MFDAGREFDRVFCIRLQDPEINKGQSTNNVFPSGIKVAVVTETPKLFHALDKLVKQIRGKEKEYPTAKGAKININFAFFAVKFKIRY